MKEIVVRIGKNGEISIEGQGFSDDSCLSALKDLEKILGEAKNVKIKPEAKRHRNKKTAKA